MAKFPVRGSFSNVVQEGGVGRKRLGFTLIELLVVVSIIALLISILLPSLGRAKEMANRVYCEANCRGITQSMVAYSEDGNGTFPAVPGPLTPLSWNNFSNPISTGATTPNAAIGSLYGPNGQPGSPSACLWILTLQGQAPAKMFICKSDRAVTGPAQISAGGTYFNNVQDQYQISYSIAYPWAGSGLSQVWHGTLKSSNAVMADMAPLPEAALVPPGNSHNHEDKGQSVAFGDGHAEFLRRPDEGQQDNIYLVGPQGNQVPIAAGNIGFQPGPDDSVMVPQRDFTGQMH